MSLQTREKWLLAVLPAVLLCVGLELASLRTLRRETKTLDQNLANRSLSASPEIQLTAARQGVEDLKISLADSRKRLEQNQAGFDRALALQRVSELAESCGITLLASELDPSAKPLPVLLAASDTLVRRGNATPPQVWKVDLRGSYAAVVALVKKLETSSPLIVPLGAVMTSQTDLRQPLAWQLSLWL